MAASITTMRLLLVASLLLAAPVFAQTTTHEPPTSVQQEAAKQPAADPLATLDFLLGTWSAETDAPAGSANAAVSGTYTFRRDLNGHVLQRIGSLDTCTGPRAFDCAHHDQLTIFSDPNALAIHHSSILGFYLDSEGHVIYYTIAMPDPHTAVFTSQSRPSDPKFRLTYHLEGSGPTAVMTGKFEGSAPGSNDFHPYLVWSGTRQ